MSFNALLYTAGQMVSYELVNTALPGCPAELVKVPLAKDRQSSAADTSVPFVRSEYDKKSGQSPNNPRKPVSMWLSVWLLKFVLLDDLFNFLLSPVQI